MSTSEPGQYAEGGEILGLSSDCDGHQPRPCLLSMASGSTWGDSGFILSRPQIRRLRELLDAKPE